MDTFHTASPLGLLEVTHTKEVVHQVSVCEDPADPTPGPATIMKVLAAYFSGDTDAFARLTVEPLVGTDFQRRVWEQLRKIPAGEAISYGELAERVGSSGGSRAVGQANGKNPNPLIVPCHRVIGADGSLGGFSAGLDRKRFLLRHEGVTWTE